MKYIILILVFTSCHGTQKKGLSESPGYRVDSFYVDTLDRKPTGGLSFYSYSSSKTDSLTHLVDSLKKELDTAYLPWFRKGVVMDCSHTSVVKWNKNIKVHLSKKDFVLIIDRKKDSIIIDNNLDQ